LEATRADLAAKGIEPEPIEYPGGAAGPRSCWITDPDGYRIEVLQGPDGHADGTPRPISTEPADSAATDG
jgi:lactoylglutathione lyase